MFALGVRSASCAIVVFVAPQHVPGRLHACGCVSCDAYSMAFCLRFVAFHTEALFVCLAISLRYVCVCVCPRGGVAVGESCLSAA